MIAVVVFLGVVAIVAGLAALITRAGLDGRAAICDERERRIRAERTCEPNVIDGYEDPYGKPYSRVLQWQCGDEVCRCGGTKRRGFLGEPAAAKEPAK